MLSPEPNISPPEHCAVLVKEMGLREDVHDELMDMITGFNSGHMIRKGAIVGISRTIETRYPESLKQYMTTAEEVPGLGDFGWVWLGYHPVVLYRGAALAFPDEDFESMGKKFMQQTIREFYENPLYTIIERASGSLSDVIEIVFRDNSFVNFSETSLHRQDTRHYQIFATETYSRWLSLMLGSFAEGLFERWEVDGTMAVDILGPSSVEIDIRWD